MEKQEIMGAIEAILYVAGEPVEEEALRIALEVLPEEIEAALKALEDQYEFERRGIRLLRFGKSVQLSTRPDYADYVERLLQPVQRQNLTQAAMETLAVIAYKQPATRGDVEALRGVKCDYSVQSLLNKGLIAEAGRRDTLGKPTLFVTTDLFLRHFGIATLAQLPEIDFTPQPMHPIPEEEGLPDAEERTEPMEADRIAQEQTETPTPQESAENEGMDWIDRDPQADTGDDPAALDGGGPQA